MIMTMPWLLDMEDPTYFISEEMVEAIISPTGSKLAA